jgi:predicted DNA-binding transcriptional regulator YafY
MRAGRLLSMLILLQMRGRLTAAALGEEFGITQRTVYRDIAELEGAGIPIVADRGPQGGFQLLAGFHTKLTGLIEKEAQALPLLALPQIAAALGLADSQRSATRKVLASLAAPQRRSASEFASRFHLDPVDWYQASGQVPLLPEIARAVWDQRRLQLNYESWTGRRRRQLEPLGLVLKAGAWYLVAMLKDTARIFKVANISGLTVAADRFERPRKFDLPQFWADELRRFETALRPRLAHIRLTKLGLRRLRDLGAYAALAADNAGPADGKGHVPVELPIESTEHAALTLLRLGAEVLVDSPPELRRRLHELARQIARLHGAPGRTRTGMAD